MIFDLHCDTVWAMSQAKEKGNTYSLQKSKLQVDEEKLVQGGYTAQCFAIFVPNDGGNRFEKCADMIALYYDELQKCKRLRPAYSYADLIKNQQGGYISAVLTMEDGCPIGESFENLQKLYDLGVRMVCLTWNYPNALGYPNIDQSRKVEKTDLFIPDTTHGLTDFGKAAVKRMNGLGVIADVSHLSDAGFYDVVKTSEKPVVASHSNARRACGIVRNLTDDMLKKLADTGGVVGVTYVNDFVFEKKRENLLDGLVRHIRHIKKVIGAEHVALGSDYDGADRDILLSDASKIPLLVQRLEREGFTTGEIENITYKNAFRVFKDCLKS